MNQEPFIFKSLSFAVASCSNGQTEGLLAKWLTRAYHRQTSRPPLYFEFVKQREQQRSHWISSPTMMVKCLVASAFTLVAELTLLASLQTSYFSNHSLRHHWGKVYILLTDFNLWWHKTHSICFQQGPVQLNIIKCTGAVTKMCVRYSIGTRWREKCNEVLWGRV